MSLEILSLIDSILANTLTVSGTVSAGGSIYGNEFHGDGSNLTNIQNIFDQPLNTTNSVVFSSLSALDVSASNFYGDGSQLFNLPNIFNQSLNTTDNTTFNSLSARDVSAINFYGDGSHLTNLPNIFNQYLNTADDTTFNSLSATNVSAVNFYGDGSQLTNVRATGGSAVDDTKLPLSGGVLSGNLSGTSAYFNSLSAHYLSGDGTSITNVLHSISQDVNPTLSGNLITNNNNIVGGVDNTNQLQLSSGAVLQSLKDGIVQIQTGTSNAVEKTWTFSNSGITLPYNSVITDTVKTLELVPPNAFSVDQRLVIGLTLSTLLSSDGPLVHGQPLHIALIDLSYPPTFAQGQPTVNFNVSISANNGGNLDVSTFPGAFSEWVDDRSILTFSIPNDSNIVALQLDTTTYIPGAGYLYIFVDDNDVYTNTEDSHIHLMTGQASSIDLFLGNDEQYVKIGHNGTVVIGTHNNTQLWVFDVSGNLTLPNNILGNNATFASVSGATLSGVHYGDGSNLTGLNSAVTDKVPLSASSYVIALPGDNLLEKYTYAKRLTPNGSILSAQNRATLLIYPGTYSLGNVSLILDTDYVDVIGSTSNADSIVIKSNVTNSSAIVHEANDVVIKNISVTTTGANGYAYQASGVNSNLSRCENVKFIAGPNNIATNINRVYNGTYKDCVATGMLNFFTALGVFINCSGGRLSFGGNVSEAPGTFINCTAEDGSFGGYYGAASGIFTECVGTSSNFGGGYGAASGTFNRCIGGSSSFGANGIASGSFIDCILTGGVYPSLTHPGYMHNCLDATGDVNNGIS